MKFTRPVNREVDIDGNTFVVTFDESGVDFRLKGKRKSAHADWSSVLAAATGEQGAPAREFLGVSEAAPRQPQSSAGQASQPEPDFGQPASAGELTRTATVGEPSNEF